ncbi:GTPase HflX [Micromonospora noduli]|nr:hypothetical protein [Micromonospora noduli]RAO32722.1 GTPase HflX [Micromonospora noduli]
MAGSWLLGPDTGGQGERPTAVLVVVRDDGAADSSPGSQTSLTEPRRLAATDGLTVADEVVQRRPNPDPATYVGSGKVDELAALAESAHADLVIADRELTPGQVRNLEERVGVRVVDRSALILDIFAEHARTSEGRVQVELAQRATRLRRNASELARRRERTRTRTRRARNQVPRCRSPATPTPANRRCSTGRPAPTPRSMTCCSPPWTRPSVGSAPAI